MAGVEGFEPPNAGTRNQCLTTWRHPNSTTNCSTFEHPAQVGGYAFSVFSSEASVATFGLGDFLETFTS